MNEVFVVKNVKCGGCTSAIENGLAALPGVATVEASTDGKVVVAGEGLDRGQLAAKLAELGYPEA